MALPKEASTKNGGTTTRGLDFSSRYALDGARGRHCFILPTAEIMVPFSASRSILGNRTNTVTSLIEQDPPVGRCLTAPRFIQSDISKPDESSEDGRAMPRFDATDIVYFR
jgi:hypothetical protein